MKYDPWVSEKKGLVIGIIIGSIFGVIAYLLTPCVCKLASY